MKVNEQIKALLEKRGGHVRAMEALLKKAQDEKRTFTEAEQAEFDGQKAAIAKTDGEIDNFESFERLSIGRAAPAVAAPGAGQGGGQGDGGGQGTVPIPGMTLVGVGGRTVSRASEVKGLRLARAAIAHAVTRNPFLAGDYAAKRWPDTPEVATFIKYSLDLETRSAVTNIDVSTGPDTTHPLVTIAQMQAEFIELLRPRLVLGQLPARRLQFGENQVITIPKQTATASGGYVGEGSSIKVGRLTLGQLKLTPSKLAVITPVTNELIQKSNPSIEMLVRDDLLSSTARTADGVFVSTAAAGAAPAGILNGLSAQTLAATTATPTVDEVSSSLATLTKALRNADVPFDNPVWIMHPRTREYLRFQRNSLGMWVWKQEIDAGVLMGIPIIASTTLVTNLGAGTDSSVLVLMDASLIVIAEDFGVTIDASSEAAIQSDDAPATPPTGMVSAFQQDLTFIRLRLKHTWARRIDVGTAYGLVKF